MTHQEKLQALTWSNWWHAMRVRWQCSTRQKLGCLGDSSYGTPGGYRDGARVGPAQGIAGFTPGAYIGIKCADAFKTANLTTGESCVSGHGFTHGQISVTSNGHTKSEMPSWSMRKHKAAPELLGRNRKSRIGTLKPSGLLKQP